MDVNATVNMLNGVLQQTAELNGLEASACPPEHARTLLSCFQLNDLSHPAYQHLSKIQKLWVRGYVEHFVQTGGFMTVKNATPQVVVDNLLAITTGAVYTGILVDMDIPVDILFAASMVEAMQGKNPFIVGFTVPKNMKIVTLPPELVTVLRQALQKAPECLMEVAMVAWKMQNQGEEEQSAHN